MKYSGFSLILLTAIACFLFHCGDGPPDYTTFAKVDAHVHLRTFDPSFVQQAQTDAFQLLTINTRSSSWDYIEKQLIFAKHLRDTYPHTVFFAATFSMENWGSADWQDQTIGRLKEDFNAGAIAVKVWKDIGMTFREEDGRFIMIDDPAFEPVLEFIASEGKPLIAHLGEPKNCWLPLDSMTVNSDRGYFSRNPQYHMYLHPEYPSYEDQITSRDRMLEKHPDLKVIGAHLGSLEWDVDELAKRLDRFPHFAVDMAARICHFQVQDRDKVRRFITEYQDRLLYATDLGVSEDADNNALKKRIHSVWLEDWRYFSTDEAMSSDKLNGSFRGLKLSRDVLKKIYHDNAKKWFPEMK